LRKIYNGEEGDSLKKERSEYVEGKSSGVGGAHF